MRSTVRKNIGMKACALAVLAATSPAAWGQLRIVSMNTANSDPATSGPRLGMDLILSAIATSVSDDPIMAGNTGIAKPIDVLALQESAGWATTGVAYANLLNSLVPGANYQVAQQDGSSTGSGTQTLVYNANTLTLIGTTVVGAASTSGQPRQTTRFELRPIGYGADADVYIYNSHMKSSTGSTNEARRLTEANAIRANADALPAGSNVIYLGDFNVYNGNTDEGFQRLISAGAAQGIDPINAVGNWTSNSSYRAIHTQSPYNSTTATALGTGFHGTTGGMDDRFDFQLMTANLLDGHGLAYIPNSYQALGNNGSMAWGSGGNSINQGGNTAQPQNVLDAMASILDHLPVVADYQLPAMMSVSVSAAPEKVIVGTPASVAVAVSNSAPVLYANGADMLSYSLSSGGAVTGSASGTAGGLSAASVHTVTLSTGSVGNKSGTVDVVSSSQQVANGTFAQAIGYAVVDHSNGSLAAGGPDVNATTIDFGYVPAGFAARTSTFAIANVASPSSFTADLALPSVSVSGSTQLTTNVTPFTHLAAGAQNAYTATLNPTSAGNLSATHTFNVADEDIPGATANATPLTLTMTARVLSTATFPATGFIQLNTGETYDTGPSTIAAGVTLTKTGPGTLHVTGPQTNGAGSTLVISAGTVLLSTDAGANLAVTVQPGGHLQLQSPQHLASLTTANAPSLVDLLTNPLTLTSADPASLRQSLLANVITSTSPDADDTRSIGYIPSGTGYLLQFTFTGDANLDGRIDPDDYALIDRGMAAQMAGWSNGDFDYSGTVDFYDYLLLDKSFGFQSGVLSPAFLADREARFGSAYVGELIAAVPEPSALALSVVATSLTLGRRRWPRRPFRS